MGNEAYRQDALYKRRFSEYITEHHRSWLDFADTLGCDLSLSDLILVDGCDRTSAWACAAWSEKTQSMRLSFAAGVTGIADGSAGLWGRWVSSQSLDMNVGPRPLVPAIDAIDTPSQSPPSDAMLIDDSPPSQVNPSLSPSVLPPRFNQWVFVRGFRMGNRATFFNRKRTRIDLRTGLKTVPTPSHSKMKGLINQQGSQEQRSSSNAGGSSQGGIESRRQPQDEEYSESDESLTDVEEVSYLPLSKSSII
jgi:hypothetical protein